MRTMKSLGAAIVGLLLLTGPWAGRQLAAQQPPAQQPAPKAAQEGFVPVDSPIAPEDAMPAPRLVAIAYAFIWLVFFGYLLSIKMRLSKVEQEMAALSKKQP